MSESAIKATQLQKTYRIPVREPGVGNALRALFHPANQDVPAVTGIDFEIDRGTRQVRVCQCPALPAAVLFLDEPTLGMDVSIQIRCARS
jgi:ABC-type uncharacterized transport system ATPase subunit